MFTYYSQNYVGIIGAGLMASHFSGHKLLLRNILSVLFLLSVKLPQDLCCGSNFRRNFRVQLVMVQKLK